MAVQLRGVGARRLLVASERVLATISNGVRVAGFERYGAVLKVDE